MPAEDRGDVFVRHRGAVLDTLLSDSSLGPAESGEDAGIAGDSVATGVREAWPSDSGSVFALDPESPGETGLSSARGSGGPKASERILALLNGTDSASTAGLEFTSDYSEVTAKLTAPQESSESPAGPDRAAPEPAPVAPGSPAASLQGLIAQVKKPKVALAVAGVLAVLLVLVLVTTSGGKQDSTSRLAVITPVSAAPAQSSPAPTTPASSTIQVKSAQSHCPPGGTPGMDAFGGDGSKAWSCARAYNIDGQVLTIDLGTTHEVDSIGIVPGWDHVGPDGTDEWSKYRTVSRVSYRFDDADATTYTQQTMDQRTLVVTKMNPPVQASKIVLTVLASTGDASVNTTAISSIVITGH